VRRYSILQAVPLSFFSRDLYRDVAGAWRGIGLVYLVVVVAFLTLVMVLRMQVALNRWVEGSAQGFADQVPGIVIRHRVVEVDRPMPYVIQDRKTGKEMVVVDTTGQITTLDGREARLLLTADHLLYRKSATETRLFKLSGVDNLRVDSTRAKRWLGVLRTWAALCVAPFVFGGMFAFRMVQLVSFAVVGLVVAGLARIRLDFPALMRLAAVALTPALLIEVVLDLMKAKMRGWGFVWTLIAIGYVVWSVLSNRPGPEDAATGAPMPPPAA
jgi:hypothetical protein